MQWAAVNIFLLSSKTSLIKNGHLTYEESTETKSLKTKISTGEKTPKKSSALNLKIINKTGYTLKSILMGADYAKFWSFNILHNQNLKNTSFQWARVDDQTCHYEFVYNFVNEMNESITKLHKQDVCENQIVLL